MMQVSMCGAYSLTTAYQAITPMLGTLEERTPFAPRYNIRPTQRAPVVRRRSSGERQIVSIRWGLVPYWSKGAIPSYATFNARSEDASNKPAYREPWRKRRCLVLADGFYEWQKLDGYKQPWRLTLQNGGPFCMAGLWDRSQADGAEPIFSFTILTVPANDLARLVHDRMPAILTPDAYGAWLGDDPDVDPQTLLQPYPSELMQAYRVGQSVNNWRNDSRELIEPLLR